MNTIRLAALPATLLLAATLVFAGCDDPNKGKAKATTGAAQAASTTDGTPYAFDNTTSKITFVGAKVTGKHEGAFNAFKGTVKVPGTDLERASVSVAIDTASISTDSEKLTGHLKTAELLDVEKFPKATFESTSVKKAGDAYTITGNFTLHGVTKSITFPAKAALAGDAVSVDADFTINRKDFGINYPGKADDLIKDDVGLKLAIKAKKS